MSTFSDRSGLSRFTMFPPVIRTLLLMNLAVFLIGLAKSDAFAEIIGYSALWPFSSGNWYPWQYVSYLFVHAGFGHIFFNMLALWMFGMELEQTWGSKRFLVFYLACGIGAGLIHSIMTMMMGNEAPTVGASGAIMGVMVAFAMLYPDRIIYVQFFLPLKAKYAVMLFIGIDLFFGFGAVGGDNVARFAHLGGALVGFVLVMVGGKMTLGGLFNRNRVTPGVAPPVARERARVIDVRFRETEPASHRHAPQKMDFGNDQERIDAILDKISKTGYQTLTDEEKAILLEASKRMR
ncbi:MAG: rhomboid family intramembrane serine protease [bacterium]|nr:rhomboid family intramembrane serine protease [Candidatus Kapabacteria bacterium]